MNKILQRLEDEILMSIDKKDLVMAIIALQHLKNERVLLINADLGIGLLAGIPAAFINMNNIAQAGLFVLAGATGIKFAVDCYQMRRINKLMTQAIEELMDKYETPQMAYIELSSMIINVTRDEIIKYLESIGCEYRA